MTASSSLSDTSARSQRGIRVIFCDYDGVLCHQRFLHHLPGDDRARLWLDRVFADHASVIRWMCAHESEATVLSAYRQPQDPTLEWILAALPESVATMTIEQELANVLARLKVPTFLATDNMPCFERAYESIAGLHGHAVEGLVCSAQTHVLKGQSPPSFYGPTLQALELSFEDALLIDDNTRNCERFRAHGGTSIHHHNQLQTIQTLNSLFT